MKITALALALAVFMASKTNRLGGGPSLVADARILEPKADAGTLQSIPNPVVAFADLSVEWVRLSERGPTVSGHFMVNVGAALFDAYAAFEQGTTGAVTDLTDIRVEPDAVLTNRENARLYAMVNAAYEVITTLGETLLNQKYLEEENEEFAAPRMEVLMGNAKALRDAAFNQLDLNGVTLDTAVGVSTAVKAAILERVTQDGSNYQGDYQDTTGYAVSPWCLPVPVITDPRTDYNFLDGSWVTEFLTFDPIKASQKKNEGFAQVHGLVRSGALHLTETYQSLTQHGIFPPEADGGEQFPLCPHWGGVSPFSFGSGSDLRTDWLGPYDVDGKLRDEWVEEHRDLVHLGLQQQDGNCPRCRAESEFWELGDEFPYPPGWWVQRATDIARDMDVKQSLQIIFGVQITVFDAGVAAWDMKYHHDSVRPVTTINEMFFGSEVSDWRGNRTATVDDKDLWRPYQLRRNIVPPFPENPSGHSAFSTSSSVVLRNLLETNQFDYTTEPFASRFDLTDGFDGDATNGNEETTLDWKTFSQAADAAGYSRLYGGIHPMSGNVAGLFMGSRVGHLTLEYLRNIFGEADLGRDPVADVWNDIVFGTGKDDALLVAPCGQGGPVEVYGFYGNDVLASSDTGDCGDVSLFGGDGADIFRITLGAFATIQDYESQEIIELVQGAGEPEVPPTKNKKPKNSSSNAFRFASTFTTSIANAVTTVSVNGVPALAVDGEWDALNIVFV